MKIIYDYIYSVDVKGRNFKLIDVYKLNKMEKLERLFWSFIYLVERQKGKLTN